MPLIIIDSIRMLPVPQMCAILLCNWLSNASKDKSGVEALQKQSCIFHKKHFCCLERAMRTQFLNMFSFFPQT